MLPFGSLFTQVPLIILAAAYMLYFGAYAVGKSKELIAGDEPESKEQQVIPNTISAGSKTFYFNKSVTASHEAVKSEIRVISFAESDISIRYCIPDRKTFSCYSSYNLFSRPPPYKG
jgi:hypothetical protein